MVSIKRTGKGFKAQSPIVDPKGYILQQAGQLPESLMAMLNLGHVRQVRE